MFVWSVKCESIDFTLSTSNMCVGVCVCVCVCYYVMHVYVLLYVAGLLLISFQLLIL